jgi:hypothetical protein
MSFLKKLTSIAIPTTIGFATGGPAGAFSGFVAGSEQEKAERQYKRAVENEQKRRQQQMSEIFGTTGGLNRLQAPMIGSTTSQAGFGTGFRSFLTDVGRNIVSPFAGLATQLAPFFGKSVAQQPAVTSTRSLGAQESQQSGANEAFIGGIGVPGLINVGRQFLRSPIGQIGTGTAVGGLLGGMTGGQPAGMRITRKMKSQARTVLNMVGGDLSAASQILGIDEATLVQVLLKRFRNDGPVVTKAALRKTKQTVRRLKSMCDMYDDLRPRAAARRRTPMKRASTTTLIKN